MSSMTLILGPVQIGYSVATFLYGLMTFQMYSYFRKFHDDPMLIKTLVAILWVSELGHHLSLSHGIFYYTISEFSNPRALLGPVPNSFAVCLIFHGLTTFSVSWFFIVRLWIAARKIAISLFLSSVMITRSIMMLVVAGFAFDDVNVFQFFSENASLLTASLGSLMVGEIFVTMSLCYDLSLQRQTPIYRIWTFIDRFMMWSIATGVLTSFVLVVVFICYMTMKSNLIWLGMFLTISRLFAISLLTSLNARSSLPPMTDPLDTTSPVDQNKNKITNNVTSSAVPGSSEKLMDPNIDAAVRIIITKETISPWHDDLHRIP